MNRPKPEEFYFFYQRYTDTVPDDVIGDLQKQLTEFTSFLRSIPEERGDYAYAEGKWTVKELVGHLLDTERIMSYRALRVGRGDATPLAGFEENEYAVASHYEDRSMQSLADEFSVLRNGTLFLIESFNEEELSRTGTASGWTISCRALVFILAGHVNHHRRILEERYLLS